MEQQQQHEEQQQQQQQQQQATQQQVDYPGPPGFADVAGKQAAMDRSEQPEAAEHADPFAQHNTMMWQQFAQAPSAEHQHQPSLQAFLHQQQLQFEQQQQQQQQHQQHQQQRAPANPMQDAHDDDDLADEEL